MLCIILFIGAYTLLVFDDNEATVIENNQIPVPKLEDEQDVYESKLDALNDLKEVRQTNAPSIYDEKLLDSTGVYDPDLLEKEKQRIMDSIYNQDRMAYNEQPYQTTTPKTEPEIRNPIVDTIRSEVETLPKLSVQEISLEHQLFFASNPEKEKGFLPKYSDQCIPVIVDGNQTVKANYRLRMRSMRDVVIKDIYIPRNTLIYGFISFQPNRALIEIDNINQAPVKLKAFDFQDGREGIYVENSFRSDATREVIDDVAQDINISGVPQVSGIKKIFRRDNRNTKVTVLNNYQLILKPMP
ncbi:conjugative transposon protein TraM [Yeosuana marina]|uniref:conjugative transposon protein TraM n=1 Tax=Yeosuana marina TaxID=1565536 RepID=UPI00293C0D9F|nr:conjugative transposon protein TraM [Yeosuana marina]